MSDMAVRQSLSASPELWYKIKHLTDYCLDRLDILDRLSCPQRMTNQT